MPLRGFKPRPSPSIIPKNKWGALPLSYRRLVCMKGHGLDVDRGFVKIIVA